MAPSILPLQHSAVASTPAGYRYVAFDGLRGLLAIFVVIYHFAQMSGVAWFNKAWIAVDIFFVLSGFVITRAYAFKIDAGMGFATFMWARIKRLYPFYLFGLALGLVAFFFSAAWPRWDVSVVAITVLCGIFLVPFFTAMAPGEALGRTHDDAVYPLNAPAWSLFFELFINFYFYFHFRYLRRIHPLYLCLLAVPFYIAAGASMGVHSGWGEDNFIGGFPRVMIFFFLGAAIYGLHLKLPLMPAWWLAALVLLLVMALIARSTWITLIALFVVGPAAVVVGSRVDLGRIDPRLIWLMEFLGYLSYPLYIIHYPVGHLLQMGGLLQFGTLVFVTAAVLVSLAVTYLAIVCGRSVKNLRADRRRAMA